jgi:uncharacterized protein (TIGR02271 family)
MLTQQELDRVVGSTAVGSDGKLGKVGQVFLDDETGRPEWATVQTGLIGTKETFVPLAQAEFAGENLRVPYDKGTVKNAPNVDVDQGHLSESEEAELYRYYDLDSAAAGDRGTPTMAASPDATTGEGAAGPDRDGDAVFDDVAGRAVGRDTSGPTTDDAMTRSEERLHVGTRAEEVGRARLRKYVTTENVTETVPVSREQVRVEREPITDANIGQAMDGPAISEEEHEVTLRAERPVVEKEAVPMERIRLEKNEVTDHETVADQVRQEQIEVDDSDLHGRR